MTHSNSIKQLSLALVVAIVAVGLGFGLSKWQNQSASSTTADHTVWTTLPSPRPIPNLPLTKHDNTPFTPDQLNPQWSLWFFGFTNCPSICPTALKQLSHLHQSLPPEMQTQVQLVFVSVDPKRDTPDAIKRYLSGFQGNWLGLHASPDTLDQLATAMGVAFAEVQLQDEITFDHSSAVYWVNPDGQWASVATPPVDYQALKAAIVDTLD